MTLRFVATTGSDSNAGTSAAPWLTVGHAAQNTVSGDIVSIGPGTFQESIPCLFTTNVTVNGSGKFSTIIKNTAIETALMRAAYVSDMTIISNATQGTDYPYDQAPFGNSGAVGGAYTESATLINLVMSSAWDNVLISIAGSASSQALVYQIYNCDFYANWDTLRVKADFPNTSTFTVGVHSCRFTLTNVGTVLDECDGPVVDNNSSMLVEFCTIQCINSNPATQLNTPVGITNEGGPGTLVLSHSSITTSTPGIDINAIGGTTTVISTSYDANKVGTGGILITEPSMNDTSALELSAGYAAGTAYTLTTTPAAVALGTVGTSFPAPLTGSFILFSRANVKLNAATFIASQEITIKVRNVTAGADIPNALTSLGTGTITTLTKDLGAFGLSIVTFTASKNDVISLFASVASLPSAGTVTISEADVFALAVNANGYTVYSNGSGGWQTQPGGGGGGGGAGSSNSAAPLLILGVL